LITVFRPDASRPARSAPCAALPLVGVVVLLPQIGLVHVLMRVFSSVGVGVGVIVLDMLVVVAGVRVRVRDFVVLVFVGVRFVVTVFMVCHCHPLYVEIPTHPLCSPR
jgi:hypothetical protein